jgi:hypothetical protein
MFRALALCSKTGLLIVRVMERGVRVHNHQIEIGPDASRDVVATIAVRRFLDQLDGDASEPRVRAVVEELGYDYVPVSSGLHPNIAEADSRRK